MQDYQLVIRAIWEGKTEIEGGNLRAQNYAEALNHIRENYLSHGYKIQEVHFMGVEDVYPSMAPASPKARVFAWHLVCDIEEKPAKVVKGDA